MLLEHIQSPADVKKLSLAEMNTLAEDIRTLLIEKLSRHGGHCGPNLGMVEATIALHYVFDSPRDKIVFDVSHQSYPHKMLTGRVTAFLSESHYDDVSGYSEPSESEHDFFVIGHTSTSVSLAGGLAKGRDLRGETGNVIAVIGDGSLSGGEALEGLDWAAELNSNFIIVVNDNQMSIAENHGGLYENLAELRRSHGSCENNLFRAMGLDYVYVDKGNALSSLIEVFRKVKDTNHPVVVHINTLKGKGYAPAEEDKETWHWTMPFEISTGALKQKNIGEDYNSLTAAHLLQRMKDDQTVCAITAGTPGIWGWTPARRQEAGKQFVDVGIAEEHAVALASGMAKAGGKPVFGVCSSFLQRAYDQVSQDLCINDNPATLLVLWGSLTSMTDVTHLCHFDIPLLSGIPNLVFLAPTNREEYLAMLDWSLAYDRHPVAIRVPVGEPRSATRPVPTDFSELNKSELVSRGKDVAILGLGNFFALGEQVSSALKDRGIEATLINPRFISGLDESLLDSLVSDHRLVVTLEDGALEGGYGEKVARHFGPTSVKTLCFGARKEFVDRYAPADFFAANHLTVPQIVEDILQSLGGF
ncbi:MAG: 1-deoxy-D-xylulose-5-phosphate synthase [Bacteroidales bacterium]|nr:1-deoxy-D-xylulose-5-phosphate synthase [Bacteroidales bacterium]MDY4619620.1 1-deoxy-D-xylulose-5-phosphate synthase [Alloprevotella sp.]